MSVQPGPTFKRYAANGSTPTFAIPFLLLDAADLQITLNGVLVTSGFTLAGIGNPISSCTFTANPTGDLLFQQVMTFQRLTDYQMNGDFLAGTVNRDCDRLWLAVKQLNRDSGRALTVSLQEPEGIPSLPVKAARALKMLAFDADGNPVSSNLTMAQIEQQPALALSSAEAAAASALAASNSKDAAASSADNADVSALLAQKWAENPEDTPVAPGLFSAHHWAIKAAATVASVIAQLAGKLDKTDKRVCTAWVSFNGSGTVSIRDGYNVSSITDNGVGDYTVNFSVAMSNANFCATVTSCPAVINVNNALIGIEVSRTTSAVRVNTVSYDGSKGSDCSICNVHIAGGK